MTNQTVRSGPGRQERTCPPLSYISEKSQAGNQTTPTRQCTLHTGKHKHPQSVDVKYPHVTDKPG